MLAKPTRCAANLVLALLFALPVGAQQGVTSDSVWGWTYMDDAQISPDGSRIAFVRISVSDEKDTYTSAIWLADLKTGEVRQLTNRGGGGAARDLAPRWSPAILRSGAIHSRIFCGLTTDNCRLTTSVPPADSTPASTSQSFPAGRPRP